MDKPKRARPALHKKAVEADAERYRAPALDKGLDILELLSEQPGGLTRSEIVKALDRSPSEIYRMLERLVARDYVSRSPEGDRHSLSLKLFVMANRHPPLNRLASRALPVMEAFAEAVRQSCHLAVLDRGMAAIVVQVSGPGPVSLAVRVGTRIPLATSGSGRVLLAFNPQAQRELVEVARGTLPDKALLQGIAKTGHWIGESHQTYGVIDMSWPLLGPNGEAFAALTCPFLRPLDTVGGRSAEDVAALLAEAARELSLV